MSSNKKQKNDLPYLNLGCGSVLMKNAVNVDMRQPHLPLEFDADEKTIFVQTPAIEYLEECPRQRFQKIFMFYFIEHLTYNEVEYLTYLLNKALVNGGFVIGVTENFTSICEKYLEHPNQMEAILSLRYCVINEDVHETPHRSLWNLPLLNFYFCKDEFKLVESQQKFGIRGVGLLFKYQKVGTLGLSQEEMQSFADA